jgi:chlorophyllide a reductase subunit Z
MYREFGRKLCEALDKPYLQAPIGLHSTTKFLESLGELLGLDPQPFIEREKHTTIKPLWDLWRSVTQDFLRHRELRHRRQRDLRPRHAPLPRGRAGHALQLRLPRCAGMKTDNDAVRAADAEKTPLILFRQLQRAHVPRRERWARSIYIPASLPGTIIRRHTGTPFMGYAGA